jgi:hypothetical protein
MITRAERKRANCEALYVWYEIIMPIEDEKSYLEEY